MEEQEKKFEIFKKGDYVRVIELKDIEKKRSRKITAVVKCGVGFMYYVTDNKYPWYPWQLVRA